MSSSRAARLVAEVQETFEAADRAGRELSVSERVEIQAMLDEAESLSSAQKSIDAIGRQLGSGGLASVSGPPVGITPALSPGAMFVESPGFKALSDPSRRGQKFSSGMIEVGPPGPFSMGIEMKGTLGESAAGGPIGGGAFVSVPQVVPGVVNRLFQPLMLEAGAFLAQTATTSSVRYIQQGTATSGAAGVAEAGTKPASTLGFSTVDEPIKKIATLLPLSDEILEDAPSLQQFVNGQLMLFVQLEAERQLLRGTSGGNEVQGLLTSRNVPIYAAGTAGGSKAEQIFRAMNGVRGSAFVECDFAIIHPTDYEQIRLQKDSANQLMGGGPFQGPYGNGVSVAASGQVTGAVDQLWGKDVFVSAAVGSGTAVVGSRACGAVFNRGGPRVEVTNSHDNWFELDLVAIRCERRLGLAIFRPQGYCEVRLA